MTDSSVPERSAHKRRNAPAIYDRAAATSERSSLPSVCLIVPDQQVPPRESLSTQ